MPDGKPPQGDAYQMILRAIDQGAFRPGDRLVEIELADRFGVSRTPIREALQRLEMQSLVTRDGRSMVVATLDHTEMADLYVVRSALESLAARLAARHATQEEVRVLRRMIDDDAARVDEPEALARSNRMFHRQVHLASHNRFLVQQLDLVFRSMALMASTSLSHGERGRVALAEHATIVDAIASGDGDAADAAFRAHVSHAFETRLRQNAEAHADGQG